MKITVKRKCDGKTGVVKTALGSFSDGFTYFVVVFDDNSGYWKAKVQHSEILSISIDDIVVYQKQTGK